MFEADRDEFMIHGALYHVEISRRREGETLNTVPLLEEVFRFRKLFRVLESQCQDAHTRISTRAYA